MESRKYHLQKQIVEALKANDNDLYFLLKSQWAHRFGVESLEELKNLDLNEINQVPINVNNEEVDELKENSIEVDKAISMQEEDDNNQILKIKSYEIVDKENNENKALNSIKDNKSNPEIKALIPLPPKPRYGFLKKWVLRK